MWDSDIFWFIFSMVLTRGYGSGSGAGGLDRSGLMDDHLWELIVVEMASVVRGVTLELFGSIKTDMIKLFDK